MSTWNILWTFGIFYDNFLHFVFIWYIFSGFGMLYQEKSGNPGMPSIVAMEKPLDILKKLITKTEALALLQID
jgi:hypothetical protein